MHVNNEIGSIQPIEQIAKLLKSHKKILFHTDAVQSFSKLKTPIKDVDLLSISGHKLNGLKGTGLLYVKSGVQIDPLFSGGGQEFNVRSGTENLAGAASLARAMRLALNKLPQANQMNDFKKFLIESLLTLEGVNLTTPKESAPHIIHFSVPGIKPETLIHALAQRDIYVSTQSACSSKSVEVSRVLLACGYENEIAKSGIRVSLSYETTKEEIEKFIHVLKEEIEKIQEMLR